MHPSTHQQQSIQGPPLDMTSKNRVSKADALDGSCHGAGYPPQAVPHHQGDLHPHAKVAAELAILDRGARSTFWDLQFMMSQVSQKTRPPPPPCCHCLSRCVLFLSSLLSLSMPLTSPNIAISCSSSLLPYMAAAEAADEVGEAHILCVVLVWCVVE
jgi:hypothetical protein